MAFEPYKRGDAIRRQPPLASICLDCKPFKRGEHALVNQRDRIYGRQRGDALCEQRRCDEYRQQQNAVDQLARVGRKMEPGR